MKYECSKTKQNMMKIIIEEFERAKMDYEAYLNSGDCDLYAENQKIGALKQMTELLKKLEIFEEE